MASHDIKLEVCVDSIRSAFAAEAGGAARIELCSALGEGGLTPSVGTLKTLKETLTLPIYCMLRPRRGTDFVYSDEEMCAVLTDMDLLRENGADGFVFGSLNPDRSINVDQCRQVMLESGGLPVTFHRAFDLTDQKSMDENVELLRELGFKRLLTSGFRPSAADGLDCLAQLIAKHHRDFIVMPGAGIKVSNLEEILTVSRCLEFHASAQDTAGEDYVAPTTTRMECDVTMGKQDVDPYFGTNANVVRKMVTIANAMSCR
ncbi:copper homeostasis protein cutC homolog isoform X1 [Drosophila subpulchrella]|uniref:copper homeostasis protein cutC homolog isoform X1 n=1 Tax=Drosophila subpulchrella TaxID=1486046 RepID=UPI0018A16C11|nr:copper homeostasis protein cutC homolog isoform X1 [Drosophila subpulchrella]